MFSLNLAMPKPAAGMSNPRTGCHVLVWAKDEADGQVKGFIVETSATGFRAELMPGRIALRAVENAEVILNDVRVPEADRLAGE